MSQPVVQVLLPPGADRAVAGSTLQVRVVVTAGAEPLRVKEGVLELVATEGVSFRARERLAARVPFVGEGTVAAWATEHRDVPVVVPHDATPTVQLPDVGVTWALRARVDLRGRDLVGGAPLRVTSPRALGAAAESAPPVTRPSWAAVRVELAERHTWPGGRLTGTVVVDALADRPVDAVRASLAVEHAHRHAVGAPVALAGPSTIPAGQQLVLPFALAVPLDTPCSGAATTLTVDAVVASRSPYGRAQVSVPVNVHDPHW